MVWKQERLKAVAMSCPSRTQVELIRPMNFAVSSSDLKCDSRPPVKSHVALKRPSRHKPVNGLENVPRREAKSLFILVLALPAWTEDMRTEDMWTCSVFSLLLPMCPVAVEQRPS